MIKNEKDYIKTMKLMIRKVQSGEKINTSNMSIEECEALSECIKQGYINGTTSFFSSISNKEIELRTGDGKIHPEITNNVIPLKGLQFLNPDTTSLRANMALYISVFALLISLLSNLENIIKSVKLIFNFI